MSVVNRTFVLILILWGALVATRCGQDDTADGGTPCGLNELLVDGSCRALTDPCDLWAHVAKEDLDLAEARFEARDLEPASSKGYALLSLDGSLSGHTLDLRDLFFTTSMSEDERTCTVTAPCAGFDISLQAPYPIAGLEAGVPYEVSGSPCDLDEGGCDQAQIRVEVAHDLIGPIVATGGTVQMSDCDANEYAGVLTTCLKQAHLVLPARDGAVDEVDLLTRRVSRYDWESLGQQNGDTPSPTLSDRSTSPTGVFDEPLYLIGHRGQGEGLFRYEALSDEVIPLWEPTNGVHIEHADLSPSRDSVAFFAFGEGDAGYSLRTIELSPSSAGPIRLASLEDLGMPPWSPGGLAWAADGRSILVLVSSCGHEVGLDDPEACRSWIEQVDLETRSHARYLDIVSHLWLHGLKPAPAVDHLMTSAWDGRFGVSTGIWSIRPPNPALIPLLPAEDLRSDVLDGCPPDLHAGSWSSDGAFMLFTQTCVTSKTFAVGTVGSPARLLPWNHTGGERSPVWGPGEKASFVVELLTSQAGHIPYPFQLILLDRLTRETYDITPSDLDEINQVLW